MASYNYNPYDDYYKERNSWSEQRLEETSRKEKRDFKIKIKAKNKKINELQKYIEDLENLVISEKIL